MTTFKDSRLYGKEQPQAAVTFFHPDCYCRPRSFTESCALALERGLALAGFTAGQELALIIRPHLALKVGFNFYFVSIVSFFTGRVNPNFGLPSRFSALLQKVRRSGKVLQAKG